MLPKKDEIRDVVVQMLEQVEVRIKKWKRYNNIHFPTPDPKTEALWRLLAGVCLGDQILQHYMTEILELLESKSTHPESIDQICMDFAKVVLIDRRTQLRNDRLDQFKPDRN